MRLHLLKLTIFGFQYIKKIDILDSMDEVGEKNYSQEIGNISNLKVDVMVNDDSDICAKITKRLKKASVEKIEISMSLKYFQK